MTTYIIDEEAYLLLNEFSEQYKTATKYCPYFDKKSKVKLKGYDDYTFVSEAVKTGYKFALLGPEKQAVKGKILVDETGTNDFSLKFDITDDRFFKDEEEFNVIVQIMQVFCTAFVEVNCFMWYGNFVENRKLQAAGRNEENNKIITLRKYKDKIYAVPLSHHRSPEGVFSVRGHFRHYQDGKVIWIDEFLKGVE